MPISICLNRIENVSAKAKRGKIVITMETDIHPGDLARLFNLDRQGSPLSAVIESPQATFDLKFEQVNTDTGEVQPIKPVSIPFIDYRDEED